MKLFSVIIAALVLAACAKPIPPGGAHIDPSLLKLIPSDTTILVGGKLDQLRKTQMFEKYVSRVPIEQLDRFAKETGLDPRKDLNEILFCSNIKDSGLLLIRGKFNPTELEAKIESRGGKRSTYKNKTLLAGDDQRGSLFFLNSEIAVAGSNDKLKAIIDGAPGGLPPTLLPLVTSISIDAQFWAAFKGSVTDTPIPQEGMMGIVAQMIRPIQEGTFAVDLRQGLDAKTKGTCDTEQNAKLVGDGLKGAIGFGRLNSPEEFLPVFDAIKIQQQGRTVEVAANIPQAMVDHFVKAFFPRAIR
jgi:hypothetical protein